MASSPSIRNLLKSMNLQAMHSFFLTVATVVVAASIRRITSNEILASLQAQLHLFTSTSSTAVLLPAVMAITAAYLVIHRRRPRAVYLVEYACFRPDSTWRFPMANSIELAHLVRRSHLDDKSSNGDDYRFVTRMCERSGLGDETSVPPSFHFVSPLGSLADARCEAETVVFNAIDDLLAKSSSLVGAAAAINAIDVLVVNCSAFTPTPSIADMIARRYSLRGDIRSVQLSGMGCSAGFIAVGLARNLLQTAPTGALALVVSTEILSGLYYTGRKREMQLSNMLFRSGGAAVLLSACSTNARFQLSHLVRRSNSSHDEAYRCVIVEEDGEGNRGLNLSKDLLKVAGNALRDNLAATAPLVLPITMQISFLLSVASSKLLSPGKKKHQQQHQQLRIMDHFRTAFKHFCIHAGGRAVIDSVQHGLNLSDEEVEASRMTLHRFGNTSSSSMWYELAYSEAKGRIKKGDLVLMIGFGSGYKCNSAIWKCIRPSDHADRAWEHCIDRYPLQVPKGIIKT